MTKSECYSQISICNAGIEEDQKKIREWEEKIDFLGAVNVVTCKLIFMRIRTDAWNGDRKIWLIFVLVIAGKSVRQEIIFRR